MQFPKEFSCPITLQLLEDCVLAEDGHTYERRAIVTWFETGQTRSPVTNQLLKTQVVFPNYVLKKLILQYRVQLGGQLVEACVEGSDDEGIRELLDRGADVDTRQAGTGRTPLMLLIAWKRFDLALGLIHQYGADASLADDGFQTSVDVAQAALADLGFVDQLRQAEVLAKHKRQADALAKAKAREQFRAEQEQCHSSDAPLLPLLLPASPHMRSFPSLFTLQFETYSPHALRRMSPRLDQEGESREFLPTGLLLLGLAVVGLLLLF